MSQRSVWFAVAVIVLSLMHSAHAATTFYSNRASFLGAVLPATNIDFEGIAPGGSYAGLEGSTISGVTFTTDSTLLIAIDSAFAPSYYDWGSGAVAAAYFYADPLHAALPGGKFAVGADVMIADYSNGGTSQQMFATVTLLDSSTVSQNITTPAYPARGFMGFFSDQPIVSISFYTPDISGGAGPDYYPFPLIDNFVFSTPEPSSLAAIASMSLVLLRRRR